MYPTAAERRSHLFSPKPDAMNPPSGAAIIPVTMRTDDEHNYTLMLFDEIKVEKTDDVQADILKATQLQADWLGNLIKEEPKFWFWLHRRFKNDHPKIYSRR